MNINNTSSVRYNDPVKYDPSVEYDPDYVKHDEYIFTPHQFEKNKELSKTCIIIQGKNCKIAYDAEQFVEEYKKDPLNPNLMFKAHIPNKAFKKLYDISENVLAKVIVCMHNAVKSSMQYKVKNEITVPHKVKATIKVSRKLIPGLEGTIKFQSRFEDNKLAHKDGKADKAFLKALEKRLHIKTSDAKAFVQKIANKITTRVGGQLIGF